MKSKEHNAYFILFTIYFTLFTKSKDCDAYWEQRNGIGGKMGDIPALSDACVTTPAVIMIEAPTKEGTGSNFPAVVRSEL